MLRGAFSTASNLCLSTCRSTKCKYPDLVQKRCLSFFWQTCSSQAIRHAELPISCMQHRENTILSPEFQTVVVRVQGAATRKVASTIIFSQCLTQHMKCKESFSALIDSLREGQELYWGKYLWHIQKLICNHTGNAVKPTQRHTVAVSLFLRMLTTIHMPK